MGYKKTVEETCEHFAIIDQEIVWYGNINLLAKAKIVQIILDYFLFIREILS